jgi:hypothetical protein
MSRAIGWDPGTMFFQVAERDGDDISVNIIRNSFVEIEATEEIEQVLAQNNWQYISDGKKFYIFGEDSLKVAKMFPGKIELRRPMQDGVLNKGEDKKMMVMTKMLEDLIGKAPDDNSAVCFCVSSESIDNDIDNTFHKARLEGMAKRLGYNVKIIEEGHAVVLAERPVLIEKDGSQSPYSGLGISCGAGKVNCVLAYKGMPVIGMSATRSGDYIDQKVADQTDTPIAQVTSIKENKLDFNNIDYDDDVIFALDAYYTNMIEYVFKNFAKKFAQVKSEFDAPLDIVLAGGTSMPKGFAKKVESVVRDLDLPFQIKNVIHSKDPRNSVVKGCLTQAIISQKKLRDKAIEEALD